MTPSTPALAVAYTLHMLATVVWIGGLAALALLVLPAAAKLERAAYAQLLSGIQRRLDSMGWFSLALLAGTGLFQMSASPHYKGFLAVQGTWATAILAKHLVFGGMIVLSAYLTWGVLPRLQRTALLVSQGVEPPPGQSLEALVRSNNRLLQVNLALAVVVLVLTAVARSV